MGFKYTPPVCDIRLDQVSDEVIGKFTEEDKMIY